MIVQLLAWMNVAVDRAQDGLHFMQVLEQVAIGLGFMVPVDKSPDNIDAMLSSAHLAQMAK